MQESLFSDPSLAPEGLRLVAGLITPAEEAALLVFLEGLEYQPFVMRGQASKRGVAPFGASYGLGRGAAPPVPPELLALRARAAGALGLAPEPFVMALVNRYPPGAGIGWHRDYAVYGPTVLGVSLGSAAILRLRPAGALRPVHDVDLAPRSLYALSGPARATWEHSLPPVRSPRWSVTFRTLARAPGAAHGR